MKKKTSTGFYLLIVGFLLTMQFTFFRMTGLITTESTSPVLFNTLGALSIIGLLMGIFGLAMVLSVKKKPEQENEHKPSE
ncbi:MAG: hypothetical protein WCM76_06450 [Bacteroidota bacterium]